MEFEDRNYLLTVIEALEKEVNAKQARIDELMLEYCPDEVTDEQWEEYSKHQVPIEMECSWKDLTDDELWDLLKSEDWTGRPLWLMCAVIDKFKEKNK